MTVFLDWLDRHPLLALVVAAVIGCGLGALAVPLA